MTTTRLPLVWSKHPPANSRLRDLYDGNYHWAAIGGGLWLVIEKTYMWWPRRDGKPTTPFFDAKQYDPDVSCTVWDLLLMDKTGDSECVYDFLPTLAEAKVRANLWCAS